MLRRAALLLFLILICLSRAERVPAQAQRAVTSLQTGTPVERTLGRGEVHRFSITLEQDQFLQLVVDQLGIDVVVRVFSPDGKGLGEFDTPNGNQGPENVSVVSNVAGTYYIEVAPLGPAEDVVPGQYEIRTVELRHATEQELQAGKNQEALKARGIALITTLADSLPEIRSPQARAHAQLQAAQLLWATDDKLGRKLVTDAMAGVREYIATIDSADQDYYQSYGLGMQLRQEVLQILAPYDPEMALTFLRSTRSFVSSDASQRNGQPDQELRFELVLASQIAARDPKRALQMAEDTLKSGYSSTLTETIRRLRDTDPELAVTLAREIAAKLQSEKLLSHPEAANLAISLLRLAHSSGPRNPTSGSGAAPPDTPLLSEAEYRDLFAKTLADGLAFSPSALGFYSSDTNAARNMLNSLKSMNVEMGTFAPGSIAALEKKTVDLSTPPDPQNRLWQKYQETINKGTVDAATEAIDQAPREMRDQLYQQLSGKVAAAGDPTGARRILMDHVLNPVQRQQALKNLEQQAIFNAISKGKVQEALRSIGNLRTPRDRAIVLSQIVSQIGPGQKKSAALNLLDQARSLLGVSVQAEDQEQMNALLQISLAYSRYDSRRAFEVIDPLLDQFNEMSVAAVALNGFGEQYYHDGELIMENGNAVAVAANQLILTLGRLAVTDFDRAKADADRVQRPEVRIGALLAIAQQAINPQPAETGTIYRRWSQ